MMTGTRGFIHAVSMGVRRVFLIPLVLYQKLVSPLLPKNLCLYHPTCSEYAKLSVLRHGVFLGAFMGILRVARCFGLLFTGGNDAVPERFSVRALFSKYRDFWRFRKPTANTPHTE